MKKHAGLIIAGILAGIAACYIGVAIFFQSHFYLGTFIDGVAVGGCNAAKVEELIRDEIKHYSLKLIEREERDETISGESIGVTPVFNGEVEALLERQNGFSWIVRLFRKEELELQKVVSYDEDALEEVIGGLSCLKNQKVPVDATYSEYSVENGYSLVPADYGTTIARNALKDAIVGAVTVLADEIDLAESGCYVEPDVADDDAKLLALIDELNRYAGTRITYDVGTQEEVLDGTIISTWLSEVNNEVVVDEEAVLEYVKELGKRYNTAYQPKTLKTSYGIFIVLERLLWPLNMWMCCRFLLSSVARLICW